MFILRNVLLQLKFERKHFSQNGGAKSDNTI